MAVVDSGVASETRFAIRRVRKQTSLVLFGIGFVSFSVIFAETRSSLSLSLSRTHTQGDWPPCQGPLISSAPRILCSLRPQLQVLRLEVAILHYCNCKRIQMVVLGLDVQCMFFNAAEVLD